MDAIAEIINNRNLPSNAKKDIIRSVVAAVRECNSSANVERKADESFLPAQVLLDYPQASITKGDIVRLHRLISRLTRSQMNTLRSRMNTSRSRSRSRKTRTRRTRRSRY